MNENTPVLSQIPFSVVIVAAGSGSRFGNSLPKQFHLLNGKSVLRRTIEGFLAHPALVSIQVVIAAGFEDLYKDSIASLSSLGKLLPPVIGGETRQQSVYNALMALDLADNDIVLIHDAARPCFSMRSLNDILLALSQEGQQAASLAIPVSDTLRRASSARFGEVVDRDGLFAMQTPQGFHFGAIRQAHEKFKDENFTDDTALMSALGAAVHLVVGDRKNIKITLPEDIMLAQSFLNNCNDSPAYLPRTGIGFDVHAFGETAEMIRIGGIDIPHTHKLKGHSDADVLLHAITDALFGAISDGDIGSHFPPSNPDFKGKDSSFFLAYAVDKVRQAHGKIIHVDTVIMCEAPKIGSHRKAMQERVATIMQLNPSQVSIKATTTEELGFTGRREGIAAQAIVTVLLPFAGE